MADTGDLKSPARYLACGFESRLRHSSGAAAVGANTRAAIPALREINLRARSVKFRRIESAPMRNTHGSTSTSPNCLRPFAVAATYLVNLEQRGKSAARPRTARVRGRPRTPRN